MELISLNNMENQIQINQILELLPASVDLYEIDRSEDLSNQVDLLQECVTTNSLDKLYEKVDDLFGDRECESLHYYKTNLETDLVKKCDLEKEAACELVFETCQEKIDDCLYDRNSSNAIDDLLKNTGKFSIFMDVGLQIKEDSYAWTRSEQTAWMKKIKNRLKIKSNQWDDDIRMMLSQAGYGGRLVVYFYESIDKLINEEVNDWKSITVTNPAVAIINTENGSGDHIHMNEYTVLIPFERKNLFIDRYFKYNYVDAVCGMVKNWCENSQAVFSSTSVRRRKSEISPLAAQALQDRKYAEIFKNGSCSLSDMDITRHRDVYYINNFPCGNKCPHCGTFWID
jgi:hypothetical protein